MGLNIRPCGTPEIQIFIRHEGCIVPRPPRGCGLRQRGPLHGPHRHQQDHELHAEGSVREQDHRRIRGHPSLQALPGMSANIYNFSKWWFFYYQFDYYLPLGFKSTLTIAKHQKESSVPRGRGQVSRFWFSIYTRNWKLFTWSTDTYLYIIISFYSLHSHRS